MQQMRLEPIEQIGQFKQDQLWQEKAQALQANYAHMAIRVLVRYAQY